MVADLAPRESRPAAMPAGGLAAPAGWLGPEEIRLLEERVQRALDAEGLDGLELLGAGEISCVVAWRGCACKRLPPFDSAARFAAYRASFESYVARLRGAGITVVDSRLQEVASADGRLAAYCIQRALPAASLLPAVLLTAGGEQAGRLCERLLALIGRCAGGDTGLDAQVSNWAVDERGELCYLDVTTPLFRDGQGRQALDAEIFLAALPGLARGPVRLFLLQQILERYFDRRAIVLDLLANLCNDGLEALVPDWLERANAGLSRRLTLREVRAYHRADARTWALLHGLLRAERRWWRVARRRTYPVLLPPRRRAPRRR